MFRNSWTMNMIDTARIFLVLLSVAVLGLAACSSANDAREPQVKATDSEDDPSPLAIRLGELMRLIPAQAEIERRSYSAVSEVLHLHEVPQVAVITYEGARYESPSKLTKVFLRGQGRLRRVETVAIWPLPHPMPFFDAVDWLEQWLKDNEIEPDETLQQYFGFWRSAPRPGYESPGGLPRQEFVRMRLTPTSSLGIRWQPHPERDWILLLTISLTAEEMGKLRRLEEQEDAAAELE